MAAGSFARGSQAQDALRRRPGEMLQALDVEGLKTADVRTVFQPVVELSTSQVVGYEALTRGPAGTALEAPLSLFERMREAGQEAAFDEACRDAALATAVDEELGPPLTVFVNVEPSLLARDPEADLTWSLAPTDLRCVIELTERDLARSPAQLLQATAVVRELNWGIALDDVGADPTSLALMAMLRPDVIKLDLRLVQQQHDHDVATVIAAVNAQVQDTGAVIVAEGIETEEHLQTALAFGATLGQGYWFGAPGPVPSTPPRACEPVRFLGRDLNASGPTPFEIVRQHQLTRRADEPFIAAMRDHLLTFAVAAGPAGVVLSSQRTDERARLSGLTSELALLGVLDAPEIAVRGGAAVSEWSLVVMTPHYAAAVVAQPAGDGAPNGSTPQFEYALTHDRGTVAACARALAARLPT